MQPGPRTGECIQRPRFLIVPDPQVEPAPCWRGQRKAPVWECAPEAEPAMKTRALGFPVIGQELLREWERVA